jgi:hypothetical protein
MADKELFLNRTPSTHGQLLLEQVDDLLRGHGVQLSGPAAAVSVAIEHEGYALYPLGDDDVVEGANEGIVTQAVLIPLHMMPDESSSEEEGIGEVLIPSLR